MQDFPQRSRGMPALIPFLTYEDPFAATAWLEDVFGFEPGVAHRDDRGDLVWCQMRLGDAALVVSRATFPEHSASPRQMDGRGSAGFYVYVDDVDRHHARAVAAGARVIEPLTDRPMGDRAYRVLDLEGHVWRFATHYRRVDRSEPDGR